MAVQRIVMTTGDAAQHLKRIEGDGLRLMSVDQLPKIFFTSLKTAERRLPRLAALPLQKTQHPPAIVAGLHAGADESGIALGQLFSLHHQCRDQCRLLAWFDFKFDQLRKAAVVHGKPPLIVRRALRVEGLQGKTSS